MKRRMDYKMEFVESRSRPEWIRYICDECGTIGSHTKNQSWNFTYKICNYYAI